MSGVIDQVKADQLTADIRAALINDWQPAYERLIAWQEEDRVNAPDVAARALACCQTAPTIIMSVLQTRPQPI